MSRNLILPILIASALVAACTPATPTISTPPPGGPSATRVLESTTTPAPLVQVNACFSVIGGTSVPIWYSFEKGLFRKYGLDVNLTYIGSGTKAMTAMLAGSSSICELGASSVANAVIAKQDAVLIAGFFDFYPGTLFVTPDIKTPQDLKGKSLGVNSLGSAADSGTRLVLKKFGLQPDKDVAILAIGDDNARIAAMDAHQIAGTLLIAPYTLLARQKGYVGLLDMAKLGIPYQHLGIASSHAYIETHRPTVENFMKGILEGLALMKKDPVGTKEVMAKYMLLDPVKDAAMLDEAYQVLIVKDILAVPYPSLPGVQTLLDVAKDTNPDASQSSPEQVVDMSIIKDLEQSGFIAGLGQ